MRRGNLPSSGSTATVVHVGADSIKDGRLKRHLKRRLPFEAKAKFDRRVAGVRTANAGDKVLTEAFQDFILQTLEAESAPYLDCRRIFGDDYIELLNASRGVVVGGGGLLLYDTFENLQSDWQWGLSAAQAEKIEVPIAVVAVGYNRFRDQRPFTKAFDRSVTALLDRAAYFGVRHSGDIEKLKAHVPRELWGKIDLHFCPTLLFNRQRWNHKATLDSGEIGLSFAGDRLGHRHRDLDLYLQEIRTFKDFLTTKERKSVSLIIHTGADRWVLDYVGFDQVTDLSQLPSEEIYRTYAGFEMVISDRGHGQMLPFAAGCKIMTPITHDKLKFFLEDIGMPDNGVEAGEPDLARRLIGVYESLQDNRIYRERWEVAMQKIAATNEANEVKIRSALGF